MTVADERELLGIPQGAFRPLLDPNKSPLANYIKARGLKDPYATIGSGEFDLVDRTQNVTDASLAVLRLQGGLVAPPADAGALQANAPLASEAGQFQADLQSLMPGPWLDDAIRFCQQSDATASVMRPFRYAFFRVLAWGFLISAPLSIVAALLARSGIDLQVFTWLMVVVILGLSCFSGLLSYRRYLQGLTQSPPTDPLLIRQSIFAVEVDALLQRYANLSRQLQASPGSATPSVDWAMVTASISSLAKTNVEYLQSIRQMGPSPTETHGTENVANELTRFQAQRIFAQTPAHRNPTSSLDPERIQPWPSPKWQWIAPSLLLVLTMTTTLIIALIQIGVPFRILDFTACSYATAETRIADCSDLQGLPAENLTFDKLDLAGKNLSDSNFTNADISGANFNQATLTNALFNGAILDKARFVKSQLVNTRFVGATLKGADLSDSNLNGTSLAQADLTGANLSQADLTFADLEGANLTNANLSGADLTGARLTDAQIKGSNLDGAVLDFAVLRNLNFSTATLSVASMQSADLSGSNLSGTLLDDVNLSNSDLTGANVKELSLKGATLDNVSIRLLVDGEANLDGAIIKGANFNGISGTQPTLTNVDLSEVDFSNLDLQKADFSGSTLDGAQFTGADLRNARFVGSRLQGSTFELADASGADFQKAFLVGASLKELRAVKTSFQFANLSGATLAGADFADSNFSGATGLGTTSNLATWQGATCPDGSKKEICGG